MLNFFSHQKTKKLKNVVASMLLGELLTVPGEKEGKKTQIKKDLSSRETIWLGGTSKGKTVVSDQIADTQIKLIISPNPKAKASI